MLSRFVPLSKRRFHSRQFATITALNRHARRVQTIFTEFKGTLSRRGERCWITDAEGRRYLDAAGPAAAVNIGPGVKEIGAAMAAQSNALAFAHTSRNEFGRRQWNKIF
jgi:adenosylmethionine-8-amino-7-oxononanoate aminotransferase